MYRIYHTGHVGIMNKEVLVTPMPLIEYCGGWGLPLISFLHYNPCIDGPI